MDAITTTIITASITAFITGFITLSLPGWVRQIKTMAPKGKRNKLTAKMVIKYPFFALLIAAIFIFIPFGKWFVLFMCLSVLIISFFIARDIVNHKLDALSTSIESMAIDLDMEKLLDQLAQCDEYDFDRRKELKKKIRECSSNLSHL